MTMTAYPVINVYDDIYVRDTMGNLNGPYDTAHDAVGDHIEELGAQGDSVQRMFREGYDITHWYNDGIIRMAQGDGDHDLYVFVRSDGSVPHKPRTRASMRFCLALKHDMEEAAQRCNP